MFYPPPHTQEVNFDNGTKLTLRGVERIESGNCAHVLANGDKEYIIYTGRILYVKVYPNGRKTDYEKQRTKETFRARSKSGSGRGSKRRGSS